jgi:hypothetical protein
MDDNGNEIEMSDDMVFQLTPKGFFLMTLGEFGATKDEQEEEWLKFEAFCIRMNQDDEATHTALVFDGEGGSCVGVNCVSEEP